jgi:hypothetical protein
MEKITENQLWEDFLALGEKYKNKLDIPKFGASIICFSAKMLADAAPDSFSLNNLLYHAMQDGISWSIEEKENKKEKNA